MKHMAAHFVFYYQTKLRIKLRKKMKQKRKKKQEVRNRYSYEELFQKNIEIKLTTITENAGSTKKCCLREKQFGKEVDATKASNPIRDRDFAKTVVKGHCTLTGKFRGMALTEYTLYTRKTFPQFLRPVMFVL